MRGECVRCRQSRLGPTLRAVVVSFAMLQTPARADVLTVDKPENVASYHLEAKLDYENHNVEGSGTIRFTNRSAASLPELWFHLYPNAFSHEQTRFLRLAAGARRSGRQQLFYPGSLEIIRLSVNDAAGSDIWSQADATTPGDPDDATDRRVPLPEPLAPGQTLTLYVRFITRLPYLIERMGWVEDFYAVAQWFPKLARLESDGTWRHFPYEPMAEFSADFGNYDVTIVAPEKVVIAAAGDHGRVPYGAGRAATRFQLNNVHDFAFFAWDRFIQSERELSGIHVQSFAPPGHAKNVDVEFKTLAFGIEHYQALYGAYPYQQLVVVHPPDVAAPASGMEYPGLIVTGGPWYLPWIGTRSVQAVTLHELAHQWFYGIIANDEARFPVLDEGLATWAELEALTSLYDQGSAFSGLGVTVSAHATTEAVSTLRSDAGPLARAASEYHSFKVLAATVYARTGTLLNTFSNVYGRDALQRALHRYAISERYRHPTPESLIHAVEAEMGNDAAYNLRTAMLSDGWVDYSISGFSTRAVAPKRWINSATLQRRGTLRFPVTVALTTQSGQVLYQDWPAKSAELNLEFSTTAPVERVLIDPENKVTIESTRLNNAHFRNNPPRPYLLLDWLIYFADWLLGALMP